MYFALVLKTLKTKVPPKWLRYGGHQRLGQLAGGSQQADRRLTLTKAHLFLTTWLAQAYT